MKIVEDLIRDFGSVLEFLVLLALVWHLILNLLLKHFSTLFSTARI